MPPTPHPTRPVARLLRATLIALAFALPAAATVPAGATAPPAQRTAEQRTAEQRTGEQPATEPTAQRTTQRAALGWLHTRGNRIVNAKGKVRRIKAISWFGLETEICAPHGLWQESLDSIVDRIAGFGFNTIRLPYANTCLRDAVASSIDLVQNPDLAGLTPLEVMDAVVASARERGLRVILDRHRPDTSAQSELWYTDTISQKRWINDWKRLARRYAEEPAVVGFDLHNEPHGQACWGCADRSRDWARAATRAGNAVLAVNPRLLILVQGVERQRSGAGDTWWGGGLADARSRPIRLKVAHRVVYAPHAYPPSIFRQPWFDAANYPGNLPKQWNRTWGFLHHTKSAPVLLGEFGSRFETVEDRQWMRKMIGYLDKNKMSFGYWSYNPNSADTGGIVLDDWRTPAERKLRFLEPLLG
ncbi:glycoside hydrolase family 5 protein [Nocardioides sp. YIM 152588]|uniref:glycoside hydrolase family 5 protein n=1 Tax=Nocardioides sp. YIM 152588 TaxID=3158259 RepID=UPI0032E48203